MRSRDETVNVKLEARKRDTQVDLSPITSDSEFGGRCLYDDSKTLQSFRRVIRAIPFQASRPFRMGSIFNVDLQTLHHREECTWCHFDCSERSGVVLPSMG